MSVISRYKSGDTGKKSFSCPSLSMVFIQKERTIDDGGLEVRRRGMREFLNRLHNHTLEAEIKKKRIA